jgi:hypothetical protein
MQKTPTTRSSQVRGAQKNPTPSIPLEEQSSSALLIDLVVEALRVRDERLNRLAVELSGRLGHHIVDRLVVEAARTRNRPAHRVRLLQTLQRIDWVPDLANQLTLFGLVWDKHAAIRAAAEELIDVLSERRYAAAPDCGAAPNAVSLPRPAIPQRWPWNRRTVMMRCYFGKRADLSPRASSVSAGGLMGLRRPDLHIAPRADFDRSREIACNMASPEGLSENTTAHPGPGGPCEAAFQGAY